jgi:DNA-binding CsgD family transcriptional regulator
MAATVGPSRPPLTPLREALRQRGLVNDRGQLPSAADREAARIVRDVIDGDTERGLVVLRGDGVQCYANSAARLLHSDETRDESDTLLPRDVLDVARALLERARTERVPQGQELAWPSVEDRRARVQVEVTQRDLGWYVVVRTLRGSPGAEPTVRRLQSCWQLTLREAQVAAGVARGQSNGEVATTLGIVEKTVKNVLMAVYQKAGVRNRVELALKAHDVGVRT